MRSRGVVAVVAAGGLLLGTVPGVGAAGASAGAAAEPGDLETVLVSASAEGIPGNSAADRPQISGSGRFVTFDSTATNLVPGVTTPGLRVYRKDLASGVVQVVSQSDDDRVTDVWSSFSWPDDTGRLVGFVSDAIDLTDVRTTTRSVYLRDLGAGTTELISIGRDGRAADGASSRVMVSSTGRYVAFSSFGSNLTAAGGNGQEQVYVRDRVAGTTRLVSVAAGGGLGDARSYRGMVSADGRYVAFASFADNLVAADGSPSAEHVYLRDLQTGTTVRVSNLPSGRGSPNGGSRPYLTPDGASLIFNSLDGLVPDDTNDPLSDVYVHEAGALGGGLERVSVPTTGGDGNDDSLRGLLSDDGRYAVFNSFSGNLVADDSNAIGDVFLRDRRSDTTTLLSRAVDGGGADAQSFRPVPDDDASVVTYLSEARNLVAGDTSSGYQVYAVETGLGGPGAGPPPDARPRVRITSPRGGATLRRRAVVLKGRATDDRAVVKIVVRVRDQRTRRWLRPDGRWRRTPGRLSASLSDRGAEATRWRRKVVVPAGRRYRVDVVARDAAGHRSPRVSRVFRVVRRR